MTPYTELGYKVGDLFEVVEGDRLSFEGGSIISLAYDDGSTSPLFKLVEGKCSHSDNQAYVEFYRIKLCNNISHLQTINYPFGELDKQTKKDLLCAWVDGAMLEVLVNDEWIDVKYLSVGIILKAENIIYRVKPTISAKEAAKAKLISEAQQQLRDAQEALDKAQQL